MQPLLEVRKNGTVIGWKIGGVQMLAKCEPGQPPTKASIADAKLRMEGFALVMAEHKRWHAAGGRTNKRG